MGSIQRVISGTHGVDPTVIYNGDPDLKLERINTKNDSLDYPPTKNINDFNYVEVK